MRWLFGAAGKCLSLTPSSSDVLEDVLTLTHDALKHGLVTMSASELVDFQNLCDQMNVQLPPLTPASLPLTLRRTA